MGSSPYMYLVPYQPNFQRALDELREREFEQGRYNPVMPFNERNTSAVVRPKPQPARG